MLQIYSSCGSRRLIRVIVAAPTIHDRLCSLHPEKDLAWEIWGPPSSVAPKATSREVGDVGIDVLASRVPGWVGGLHR